VTDHDARRPRRVYTAGGEPDPRFSLANERTFLAWVRTSLALVAGGVGLGVAVDGHTVLRRVLACVLVSAGAVLAASAWRRWAAIERAMRTGDPLPAPHLVAGVSFVVVLVAVGALVLVAWG
jgi:putative membrane protein